ncbi:hypothetical protein A2866_04775 [Candidatus Roizmanbacteria bacterium RIFCSPHIGHO2_01_FULL_39_8]|uniref:O-antigen ligase-related domain-containing protein n=2 Tax=Candidatus Roizmaniibacteriota TaxID=1752723 RepID=A0A1F7GHB4_9BACT|nr:MAG: hypothetical protein A2866_04775 [Candidatus Roizmanbacteria bacterium RIFCSPHIGHO2_01_FULL_39_8]OGK28513.1 MAG: hypothetical protein A3C28_01955 [Candidatus Roizmanbacteria bacterium RIFCSPHIGHO2_02_FULL_39_9]
MKQLNKVLILLFLLLLPTQLGKHFFFDFSYVSGVRIDYLSPTIHLTDILALLLILLNFKTVLSFIKKKEVVLILGVLLLGIGFAKLPPVSFYRYIKILEFVSLFAIFKYKPLRLQTGALAFFFGALFEFILVILQFTQKHSLQGLFYLFGERSLSLSLPGIAKASLDGEEILRPYGTFSHPNSLAGFYLVIYLFILTQKNIKPLFRYSLLLLTTLLVFISFSKIAIVTLVVCSSLFIFRQKINCLLCKFARVFVLVIVSLVFLLIQTDPLTVEKRLTLVKNSLEIIWANPLFGVGLGSYVVAQQTIPIRFLDLMQPVHNIPLLLISEIGILPFLLIVYLLKESIIRFIKTYPYLTFALLMTGFFDHYWLTLQQNFLLLAFLFAYSPIRNKISQSR